MFRLEHYARLSFLVVIAIAFSITIWKVWLFHIKWKTNHNPTMAIIDTMTGIEFEKYIARLLKIRGYARVRLTEKYDYGIDIIASKDGVVWGIQVKRYNDLVKANAVRQAVTALRKYQCDRAMVVTNSEFSRVAIELARCNDCNLVDRPELSRWLR
jgi:restriction system protein